jgi:hypothetical protein
MRASTAFRRSLLPLAVVCLTSLGAPVHDLHAQASPPPAAADREPVALVLRVLSAQTLLPIGNTEVLIDGATLGPGWVTEHKDGSRSFRGLAPGEHSVAVRAVGYAPVSRTVVLKPAEGATLQVEMEPASVRLAEVNVVADRVYKGRMADFDRRRARGRGTFITRADIEANKQATIADVLRNTRGVKIDCRVECSVRMVRSTACSPQFYLDGFPQDTRAINTPLLDVGGIEVYRGPSETPGEFLGPESMCGVIVIWTHAGTTRKP